MQPNNHFVKIGRLVKTKGHKGAIKASFEVFFLDYLADQTALPQHLYLHINNQFVPYFVKTIRTEFSCELEFENIATKTAAEPLQHKDIYFENAPLEAYLQDENDLNYLIGYKVFDGNTELGKIEDIYYLPENELAQVIYQNREVLIPLNDHFITKIDRRSKRINFTLPDGLLALYLQTTPHIPDDLDTET